MAGKSKADRIAALEDKLRELYSNQGRKARLQVAVSSLTKQMLEPIMHKKINGSWASDIIVREAERITLLQALRLVAAEEEMVEEAKRSTPDDEWKATLGRNKGARTVIVCPSPELLEKAARWYIGPHILIRGAAIKIARRLAWAEPRGKQAEYIHKFASDLGSTTEQPGEED